jgi:hypothetical protein
MPSTYTTNLGIEKIATGEQSGTWGTTSNQNFDLIDEAVNGVEQVTLSVAGSSGSPNDLPITNGTSSDGRNKFIEFVDGGDLGGTAFVQLTPNDAEKIVFFRNSLSASRSVIVFQGTYNASNDFEIPNGKDVVLKFDGAGASATVTQMFVDLKIDALDATTVASTNVNATTVDSTNVEVTNIKAKDGTASASIADSTGVMTIASSVLTTADINGGTADNVTIGGGTAAAGTFTTATATTGNITNVNATTVDTTNIEVTNLKAKDGTSAGSIADSTGVVTLASSVLTTTDINGGTIDGTAIGESSESSAIFSEFEVNPSDSFGIYHFHGNTSGSLGVDPTNVTVFSIDVPYTTSGNGFWGVLNLAFCFRTRQSANDASVRVAHFKIIIARTGTNTGAGNTQVDVQIEESTNAFSEVGSAGTSTDMSLSASIPAADTSTATVDIQITSNTDAGVNTTAFWSGVFMGHRSITFS